MPSVLRRDVRAYEQVFERCGLTFRSVEAQSGEMGGDTNQEFMAVAAVGEDDFVWCGPCDYAANIEAARSRRCRGAVARDTPPMRSSTPRTAGHRRCREVPEVPPETTVEGIAFDVDGKLGMAVVPGDREVNEYALVAAVPRRRCSS